ncbi:MAG: hypothetical protein JWQ35_1470, partial [Bacteriovoracaceae bacterium]|nr:hypothetical protein [Bacteriovoracaceae bacterium]
ERPYKKALKPTDAIQYLQTELKDEYDAQVLIEFSKVLKR